MSIVGIDLSLTRTAAAIIEEDRSVTIRQLATVGHRADSIGARLMRLDRIASWLYDEVIGDRDIETWAIEGPSIGSGKNAASAHDRSGLWWLSVDRIASGGWGFPLVVPPAIRAKYATGKGNAGKDEVLAAVVRRYTHAPVENNDQADAFVIAMIAARINGDPLDNPMPQGHLAALAKLVDPKAAVA